MNVLSTMEVVNKYVSMMWVLTTVIVIMDIILTLTIILVRVSYINNILVMQSCVFTYYIHIYSNIYDRS